MSAGSAFGAFAGRGGAKEVYYVEQTCGLASMMSWLRFGAVLVPLLAAGWTWQILVYAVLSLTVVRMLPVALSLLGCGDGQGHRRCLSAGSARAGWPRSSSR